MMSYKDIDLDDQEANTELLADETGEELDFNDNARYEPLVGFYEDFEGQVDLVLAQEEEEDNLGVLDLDEELEEGVPYEVE